MIHALFIAFLILSPTQLGKHWWPEWSLVQGVRSDYLAPTLYLSDIIFFSLLVSLLFMKRRSLMRAITPRIASLFLLALALTLTRERPWLALYALIRYLQIPLVAVVTTTLARSTSTLHRWVMIALGIGLVFSVLLALTQVMIGGSTGWLWIFGERAFNTMTPGIATLRVLEHPILRPYATFPHPNALAGWLLITVILLRLSPWSTMNIRLFQSIGLVGLVLTMSRSALASAFVIALLSRTPSMPIVPLVIQFPPTSLSERVMLFHAAWKMVADHPIVGVGPGHFLVRLPEYFPAGTWLLQPVHNVFLFVMAEFGLVGIGIVIIIGWKMVRRMNRLILPLRMAVLAILLTSLTDHYWLTVQQNRILAGVVAGLCVSTTTWGVLEKRRADENAPHLLRTS